MVFSGIALLLVSVILFFVQRHQKRKLLSLYSARSVTAAELLETADAVAKEIGGGSWRDYVKLWGEVVVESPLYSEHKHEPCVYYTSKVIREYEEIRRTKTTKGPPQTKRVRASQTIVNHQRSVPFWLRDRTGQVRVQPEEAAIETVSIMDEFRPERSGKTLGYRYRESILPVARNVLVVGAVSDLTGEITINKPTNSSNQYIISLKDEETLATKTMRNSRISFYSMFGCFGIGGLLLIVGILK